MMVQPQLPDDLARCVDFHGHLCPGLVIGYCAAKLAMELLATVRAGDEELIAIVENDSCAVDAVQVLTGCTFGKGNLLFRDYGKMAFTFAVRGSSRSLRLSLRSAPADPTQMENQELSQEQHRRQRIDQMLAADPAALFDVRQRALVRLPAKARIRESFPCNDCREAVMVTRLKEIDGRRLCRSCRQSGKRKGCA